jgi:hypothetical protein
MRIKRATKQYEAWLAEHTLIVPADLALKHRQMTKARFPFLRATFYRWAQLWPDVCAELTNAPVVLSIGDLHIENFGSWRDQEGRLAWGVNDFDEAYPLPYTNDLARLATSAALAIEAGKLALRARAACDLLLRGYAEGLKSGGKPYVLAEEQQWLHAAITSQMREPAAFWKKLDDLPTAKESLPASATKALALLLPGHALPDRVAHRVAGLGSLGRQRWVALMDWRGGKIAREAKALAPSAYCWAGAGDQSRSLFYSAILSRANRSPDPFVRIQKSWIVRRLAPDCTRIDLESLAANRDEERLLYAMGWETANVHLGSLQARKAVLRDLKDRPDDWLHAATQRMSATITEDWEDWKRNPPDD